MFLNKVYFPLLRSTSEYVVLQIANTGKTLFILCASVCK